MLPIYLYKKMMLEKKAGSNYIQSSLSGDLDKPQSSYSYRQALLTKLADNNTNPYAIWESMARGYASDTSDVSTLREVSSSKPQAPHPEGGGKRRWFFRGRGSRLGTLLGLGSLIASYGALRMAEPYFVRKLRESSYGGPEINNIYTTPARGFLDAVRGARTDEDMEKIFKAINQRFEQLQKGNYAPYIFDPVTGSYDDYRNKSTFFSPIWNALRYINIFDSRSAPVYERHYQTPKEFLLNLERYADKIEKNLQRGALKMDIAKQIKAQNYLNRLRDLIEDYHLELSMKGEGGEEIGGSASGEGV